MSVILYSSFLGLDMAFWDSGLKDFQSEINQVLENLRISFRCLHPVRPDGNCFFNSIAWLMDRPGVRPTLSRRSRKIFGPHALRRAVVTFLEWNEELKWIEQFQVWKENIDREEGWLNYLRRMKQEGEYAENLVIWATALFIGKDILQASDTNDHKVPWTPVSGSIEGTVFKGNLPHLHVAYLSQRHYEPIELVHLQGEEASTSSTDQHSHQVSLQFEALTTYKAFNNYLLYVLG